MGAVHAHEANFQVTCGIESCPRSFKNFHTYKSHLYKNHREILGVSTSPTSPAIPQSDEIQVVGADLDMETETEEIDEKKQMALFILKALAISKISNSALNDILGDFSFLLETRIESLHDDVRAAMLQAGIELDNDFDRIFQRPHLCKPFDGLHTDHLRKVYFKDEMGLLVSVLPCYK